MAAGVPLTIPTILTLGRIVSIPILIVVFYLPYQWTHRAAASFGAALPPGVMSLVVDAFAASESGVSACAAGPV